jgi:sugar phosphate isomerase/epimerase
MRISQTPPLHLTYCQNIHPGESWEEHYEALATKAVAVQQTLGPTCAFGLGLRLSATAASELAAAHALEKGRGLFRSHDLYPFSINGFPYGKFHRGPVKSNVYAPDWRSADRLNYTLELGRALASWLPEGTDGSISTVPGSYAPWIQNREQQLEMARNLGAVALEFSKIEDQTGRLLHLGLEPEPDCFLETTAQTVAFFEDALEQGAVEHLRSAAGMTHGRAVELLRRHIGVCFDTCHVALQYENLTESLRTYTRAGIRISKIQLSAALRSPASQEALEALKSFREPTYLHQVKGLNADGSVQSWPDLPEAIEAIPHSRELREIRVHFHVPLFVSPSAPLASTADALDESFWEEVRGGVSPHLEIETYTFDVLPKDVHPGDIVQSIAAEYQWALDHLRASGITRSRVAAPLRSTTTSTASPIFTASRA